MTKRFRKTLRLDSLSPETLEFALKNFTYQVSQTRSKEEQYEKLCPLFNDDSWMQASFKNSNSTYNDFLADLERAWDAAEKQTELQIEINQEPIIQCIRHLLIRTSINSLAENYPPNLISKALDAGLWTSDRAIRMAANIPDAEARIDVYIALLKHFSKHYLAQSKRNTVQSQSLKDARSLSGSSKKKALVALAPYLSSKQRKELFQDAYGFSDAEERVIVLAALLPRSYLPDRQRFIYWSDFWPSECKAREEALQAVFGISDIQKRTEVLATLAPLLLEQQRFAALEDTLHAVIAYYKKENFLLLSYPLLAEALTNLTPYLTCQLRQYALDEALSFPDSQAQTILAREQELTALASFGQWIADEHLKNASRGALAFQSQIITVLAPFLSDEQLQRAFQAAFALPDGQERAQALTTLIPLPRLPEEQRLKAYEEALRVALALSDKQERIQALTALIPHLPSEQRFMKCGEVLPTLLDIPNMQEQTKLLAILVPYLNDGQVLQLASNLSDEVLTALIPRLSDKQAQLLMQLASSLSDKVLTTLLPRLSDEQAQLHVQDALSIYFSDEPAQAEAAIVLVPYLNNEHSRHALEVALRWLPVQKLVALAPRLSNEQLQRVVQDARSLPDRLQRVQTLAALLAHHLPEQLSLTTLAFALETALTIDETFGERAEALAALAPFLNAEQIQRAWEAALAISDVFFPFNNVFSPYKKRERGTQAYALAALAIYFPEQQRLSAFEQALQTVLVFPSEHSNVDALTMNASQLLPLVTLIPHLSGQLRFTALNRALEVVLAHPVEFDRADHIEAGTLTDSAPYLSTEQIQRALQASLTRSNKWARDRAETLAVIAPYLSTEQFQYALQTTLALSNKWARILSLDALAPYLTDDMRSSILMRALEDALSIDKADKARAEALGILAPYLSGELLQRALKAICGLSDWDRAMTLTKLLSVTPEPIDLLQAIRQALVKAIRSRENLSRRQILSELFITDFLRPPIFSSEALCNIASHHLFDICERWRWQ